MCLSVADCNEFFQISVNKKQSAVRQHTRRSEYFSKFRSNLEMETFGCFQKFSCKTSISHTLCYCETLFCTAISSTNLRQKLRCNTSYPQRSVGLEQSEQRECVLDTLHHNPCPHDTGHLVCYPQENQASVDWIFRPSGWDWVGADCNEFFQICVKQKAICSAVAHQKV